MLTPGVHRASIIVESVVFMQGSQYMYTSQFPKGSLKFPLLNKELNQFKMLDA